mgnify:FL=1|jgi:IS30 family transposase
MKTYSYNRQENKRVGAFMTQSQSTMSSHYRQLQFDERGQIEVLHNQGLSIRMIAEIVRRSPSTISRELRRGLTTQIGPNHKSYQAYFAETGQAIRKKQRANSRPIGMLAKSPQFFAKLTVALRQRPRVHSVDSFVHYFKNHYPELSCPCTSTVYRYIDRGATELRNSDLPKKLSQRLKRPGRHHDRLNKRILGQSIEERPVEINERQVLGHWEGDLVKGKRVESEPALLTLTERVSRYEIILKLPDYHATTCLQGLQNTIDDYGAEYFKSVTFDNGSEFAQLSQVIGPDVYFAHPYSPWERGTNENQNGLIREYIPKGKSIHEISITELQGIQDALNHRPRRSLNYNCASELFIDLDD